MNSSKTPKFNIQWHDVEQSILLWSFPTNYSVNDLRQASEHAKDMLAQSPAPQVSIVMDMRGSMIDSRSGSMDELRKAYAFLPDFAQQLIFVSPSGFTQVLLSVIMTMDERARSTTYQVNDVEEALAMIQEQRD